MRLDTFLASTLNADLTSASELTEGEFRADLAGLKGAGRICAVVGARHLRALAVDLFRLLEGEVALLDPEGETLIRLQHQASPPTPLELLGLARESGREAAVDQAGQHHEVRPIRVGDEVKGFLVAAWKIRTSSQGDPRLTLVRNRIEDATDDLQQALERDRDRRILATSQAELRSLFTAMSEGFALHEILVDSSGRPIDYRFLDVNPAFERITGLPRERLLGHTVLEVLPGTEPYWIERYGQVALEGRPAAFEAPARELGRHYKVYAYSPESGRFATVFSDITDQMVQAEERLELERKLLEARKHESVGVLAGGIAHDFNNILMAIVGHADVALEAVHPHSPVYQDLSAILTASGRAASLCRQILAYAGKAPYRLESLSLGELVEENQEALRRTLPTTIDLRLDLNPTPRMSGDRDQLRQILGDLVKNSEEAIGISPGAIVLRTGTAEYSAEDLGTFVFQNHPEPGTYAFLEIRDDGCGMSEETRRRAFDPFFGTKFPGRGLGLATLLGIVSRHQGAVRIESEEGTGTSIRVLFPVLRAEGTGTPEAAEPQRLRAIP